MVINVNQVVYPEKLYFWRSFRITAAIYCTQTVKHKTLS